MPYLYLFVGTTSLNETNEELDITKENGTKVSDMVEKANVTKNNETKGEKMVENEVNATKAEKEVDGPSNILYPGTKNYVNIFIPI